MSAVMSRCGSIDGGLLRSYCGFQRDILNDGQYFALFDLVALFDIQVGNWAESGGPDIDIVLWQRLDFTCAADDAGKILARHLGSQHFLRIGVAAIDGKSNQRSTANQDHDHNGNHLFIDLHSAISSIDWLDHAEVRWHLPTRPFSICTMVR